MRFTTKPIQQEIKEFRDEFDNLLASEEMLSLKEALTDDCNAINNLSAIIDNANTAINLLEKNGNSSVEMLNYDQALESLLQVPEKMITVEKAIEGLGQSIKEGAKKFFEHIVAFFKRIGEWIATKCHQLKNDLNQILHLRKWCDDTVKKMQQGLNAAAKNADTPDTKKLIDGLNSEKGLNDLDKLGFFNYTSDKFSKESFLSDTLPPVTALSKILDPGTVNSFDVGVYKILKEIDVYLDRCIDGLKRYDLRGFTSDDDDIMFNRCVLSSKINNDLFLLSGCYINKDSHNFSDVSINTSESYVQPDGSIRNGVTGVLGVTDSKYGFCDFAAAKRQVNEVFPKVYAIITSTMDNYNKFGLAAKQRLFVELGQKVVEHSGSNETYRSISYMGNTAANMIKFIVNITTRVMNSIKICGIPYERAVDKEISARAQVIEALSK